MAALSLMYKCEKCNLNFASPDHLKNHSMSCRGKRPSDDLIEVPGRIKPRKIPRIISPRAQCVEFEHVL
jgi:hypothetical protein